MIMILKFLNLYLKGSNVLIEKKLFRRMLLESLRFIFSETSKQYSALFYDFTFFG